MADISILSRVIAGLNRNVDISAETLVTSSVKVGGGVTNTELTKAILDGIIAHVASTSNPHSVTKAQVGLGNVDDVQQLPMSYLDTDITLAADSDVKVASQKAIKAYVDSHAGSASSALDGTFTINNTATPSKKIAFSAAGISASTTRTITMPDANVDLGALTNSNISASAAIAYSKLNLATSIVNGDINASAAIAESKLALDFSTSSLNTAIGLKADRDLSNLASTAVNASIVPAADGAVDLGAPSKNWNKLFANGWYNNAGVQRLTFNSAFDGSAVESIRFGSRNLKDSTGVDSVNWDTRILLGADGTSPVFDWSSSVIYDATALTSIHAGTRELYAIDGATVRIDWANSVLKNADGLNPMFDWSDNTLFDSNNSFATIFADQRRQLIGNDGNAVMLDWSATGVLNASSNKISNVADPVSGQDAATKAYVDAVALGLAPKKAVKVATTAAGTLATSFANGQVVDGITLVTGDRILIKDQAAPADNGIYIVAASGAPTRATDMDSLTPIDEFNGAWVPVQFGTANAGRIYVQYGAVATIGTSAINFEFYNPLAALVGGDMITVSGSTIAVDLLTNGGLKSSNPGVSAGQLQISLEASNPSLQVNGSNELGAKLNAAGAIASGASGLAVQVDGSTVEINTNALRVKDAGITLAKLASASVDENKIVSTAMSSTGAITGGSGTKLAVATDGSSIEINTNALRVKSTAYDQSTITGGSGSAAAVAFAPTIKSASEVAGEAFSATTLYAIRYGQDAETAGRVYKADNDATSTDNFYVVGLMLTVGALSAAGATPSVTKFGPMTVTSHGFTVGKPLYLSASGALTSTAPSAASSAVVRVGMVKDANIIDINIQVVGVN